MPPPKPAATRRYNFRATGNFDKILDSLFRMVEMPYRILPRVTETDETIRVNTDDDATAIKERTFKGLLAETLSKAPGVGAALTYRIEQGVYVIEPRNAGTGSSVIVCPPAPRDRAVHLDFAIDRMARGSRPALIVDVEGTGPWIRPER